MSADLENICSIIDKLTLDALTQIEDGIQHKLQLEDCMMEGESHLVKSRYILGQNCVSSLQLPSENSPEFESQIYVHTEISESNEISRDLYMNKAGPNPMRWFGYLVPHDLNSAQNMFRQALVWIVKATDVQSNLVDTVNKIGQLKEVKNSIKG